MLAEFYSRQFVIFIITGGTAAIINFGSRIIYNQWLSFSWAIILAYITGMIVAFVLARLFVFTDSSQLIHKSAMFFVVVNGLAIVQTWGISMGLVYYVFPYLDIVFYPYEMAHIIGIIFPVFTSYIGHKRWSFR